jgi:hypothetical protein
MVNGTQLTNPDVPRWEGNGVIASAVITTKLARLLHLDTASSITKVKHLAVQSMDGKTMIPARIVTILLMWRSQRQAIAIHLRSQHRHVPKRDTPHTPVLPAVIAM